MCNYCLSRCSFFINVLQIFVYHSPLKDVTENKGIFHHCTVKQDHPNSGIEVELHSPLAKETVNTVVLYNEAGETLGNLQLSLRGIFLTGCVRCRVPPVLRRARNKEGITSWTLTLRGSVLQISIGGKVLVKKRLGVKCASQYGDVSSFAFHKMSCESSFSLVEGEMQAGAMVTAGCNNSCTSD